MDSFLKGKATHTSAQQHTTGGEEKPPSNAELMASTKFIMDTATSKFSKAEGEDAKNNGFDKAKLAAAADDLVEAGQHYGKTEGKSYGTYVEKAHGYLHNYGNPSHDTSKPLPQSKESSESASKPPPQSKESSESDGVDYGKYLSQAGQLFNK